MERRYFDNPFEDYKGDQPVQVDVPRIVDMISNYVTVILEHTRPGKNKDKRGDLYVGDSGIAYMFYRLHNVPQIREKFPTIDHMKHYITQAKEHAKNYSKRSDERCAFLVGNAGIHAVSAAISYLTKNEADMKKDLTNFEAGFEACKPINYNKHGGDEILVGRAGFLSGVYWLNQEIQPPPFQEDHISEICRSMVESGRQYSAQNRSPIPLMYQYHGTEYLGAAHGLSGILHMLLEGPPAIRNMSEVKNSIDALLGLQDKEGNFPIALESTKERRADKRLVHWCHGAPGIALLLAKAHQAYGGDKYLNACVEIGDLVWKKGLLRKGPGLCHGVAGNGYVSLMLYRLTKRPKYLHRAIKFAEFLQSTDFRENSRTPDRPFSLYEGIAGTVCFLIDLLNPDFAQFPFMDFTATAAVGASM